MSQSIPDFAICEDKNIESHELANLFASVGWGDDADYQPDIISLSIAAYPMVAYCRDSNGLLIAYVSAFTDGALSTFNGELVVRPHFQRKGIGYAMLELIVERCCGVPIYGTPFEDDQSFFLKRGFRFPERAMSVVSIRNAA